MAIGLAAVTGATGFLGRHLVRQLAQAGWRVRILARRDPIHDLWRDLEPEVVIGDLADEAALDRLTRGVDLVVHAAGLTKAWNAAAFGAVNVDGTRRVAERTQGRMLLVSSLSARQPELSDYAASKRGGEDAARAILGDRLGVVRPPALYGPNDPETLPLFKLAASSPVLPLLDPQARIALMHVSDAARQIAALAQQDRAFAHAICDARPGGYGWREIFQTAVGLFGGSPTYVRIPGAVLTLLAAAGTLPRSGDAPMISVGKVRELRHLDWTVGADELPVQAPTPLYDLPRGFLHSVEGYLSTGVKFAKSLTTGGKGTAELFGISRGS